MATTNALNMQPPAKAALPPALAPGLLPISAAAAEPPPMADPQQDSITNALSTTNVTGSHVTFAPTEGEFEVVQPQTGQPQAVSPLTTATHALLLQTQLAYVAQGMTQEQAWTASSEALATQAQGFPQQEEALREALVIVAHNLRTTSSSA